MGVMSDFEPAKKFILAYPGEELLIVIDTLQQYGEMFLICYTEEAKSEFMESLLEKERAIQAQKEGMH
jgi:hypothetical protein